MTVEVSVVAWNNFFLESGILDGTGWTVDDVSPVAR